MCDNHDVETDSAIQKLMMRLYGKWVEDTLEFYTLMGRMGRIPLLGGPVRFFAGLYGRYVHGGRAATVEESLELLNRAHKITIMDCSCRVKYSNCSSPTRTCIGIDTGAEVLGGLRNEKPVSRDEAAVVVKESYEHGLIRTIIHCVTPNTYVLCNCCTCCCVPHRLRSEFRIKHAVDNGRKAARINFAKCTQCSRCTKVCPSGAVNPEQGMVNLDECMGCGLCVGACPSAALAMVDRVHRDQGSLSGVLTRSLTYLGFFGLILPLAVIHKISRFK